MNKGLFVHIMIGLFYIVSIIFIFNGEDMLKDEKIGVVFGFLILQVFSGLIVGIFSNGKWYDKKI